jgi:hypothetical protein
MLELNLYEAQVVDNDDPNKKGLVQIRVLPEQKDLQKSLLPWALPFSMRIEPNEFTNDLPENNSIIYVLIDKYWKRFYYQDNKYFSSLFDYSKVDVALSKATEITNKNYKDVRFKLYKDGGLEFHNKADGSHGFIHKSGSYSIFDKDGKCFIKASSIELNGNSKQFVTWTELNTALELLMTSLNSHTHVVASVGAPTGPASASVPPITFSVDISAAKTTTIKTGG